MSVDETKWCQIYKCGYCQRETTVMSDTLSDKYQLPEPSWWRLLPTYELFCSERCLLAALLGRVR